MQHAVRLQEMTFWCLANQQFLTSELSTINRQCLASHICRCKESMARCLYFDCAIHTSSLIIFLVTRLKLSQTIYEGFQRRFWGGLGVIWRRSNPSRASCQPLHCKKKMINQATALLPHKTFAKDSNFSTPKMIIISFLIALANNHSAKISTSSLHNPLVQRIMSR